MSRWWPGTARGSGAVGRGGGFGRLWREGLGGVGGPRSASNEKQRPKSLKWRAVTAQRSLPLQCDVMRTSCRHPAGGGGGGGQVHILRVPSNPPTCTSQCGMAQQREGGWGERAFAKQEVAGGAQDGEELFVEEDVWRRRQAVNVQRWDETSSRHQRVGGQTPPGPALDPWPHPRALVPPPDHLAAASYPTCRCCRSWDGVQKSSAHTCLHPGRERGRGGGGSLGCCCCTTVYSGTLQVGT